MTSSLSRGRRAKGWRRLWPLAPALCWLAVFCGLPLLLVALYSVSMRTEGGGIALSFTLENYQRFLQSQVYLQVTARALTIGLVVSLATLIVAYPVAYFIATTTPRQRTILLALLVRPASCTI